MVERELRLRVAARDGIADDDEVGFVRKVSLGVTVHHLDFPFRQKRGHGRINVLIRPGDLKAFFPQGGRGGGHGRAADADKMDGFDFR